MLLRFRPSSQGRQGGVSVAQLGEAAAAVADCSSAQQQQQQQQQQQTAHLQPSDFIDLVLGHRSLADEFCYMNRSAAADAGVPSASRYLTFRISVT